MRDDLAKFESAEIVSFGVSKDTMEELEAFSSKFSFPFPLLRDADGSMCADYGADGGANAERTVVVIKKDGKIGYYKKEMPDNAEILASIEKF